MKTLFLEAVIGELFELNYLTQEDWQPQEAGRRVCRSSLCGHRDTVCLFQEGCVSL